MDRIGLLCRCLYEKPDITQRELADLLSVSLGTAHNIMSEAVEKGYAASDKSKYVLTKKGAALLSSYKVDGAVIIAAGFGSRFVPLTYETPKGLLEVFGERMIERQICQLHEAGIYNITIVVGYLKEKFEYLIDKYNIKLLYNPEYSCKNTLATIYHARDLFKGKNMYLLSSDNWLRANMYHQYECFAWYSSSYMSGETSEWCLSYNKKGIITDVHIGGADSWVMYGPAFFSAEFSDVFIPLIEKYYHTPGTEQLYWEQVFMDHTEKLPMYINRQPENQIYEFENLEELRAFDERYVNNSDNRAMELLADVFKTRESSITEIRCLKAGMTNKSFLFKVNKKHYICRIPGSGTSKLINRKHEAASYTAVSGLGITENVIYFDGETGYKVSEYYEGARNADANSKKDMAECMEILRKLHSFSVTVDHDFDIRERIGFYEKLCLEHGGVLFEDYHKVKEQMNQLLDMLDSMNRPKVLAHIDSVADNFLILPDSSVKLIDWEYSGMADPLIDIAMCAIYSYYDDAQAEKLMKLYFERTPSEKELKIIYAYMALGGFLWSLWAVYKSSLGEEFGEYTIIMYRYAKHGYKKVFC